MPTGLSSRISGGGISKRSSGGRARVDRDGDLDMESASGARGRGRGPRGRHGAGRSVNINNTPTGPAADRERNSGSGSGATRGSRTTRRDPVGTKPPRGGHGGHGGSKRNARTQSGPMIGVRIQGWKESKGSMEECIRFMERKTNLKFRKTQKQGDSLILYVPTSDLQKVLDWDKARFAGVNITITADVVNELMNTTMEDATPTNSTTNQTVQTLTDVLALRYNAAAKLLDLSKLGDDQLLKQNGFFELNSTTSKMFPALMLVADGKFDSAQQKRDAIQSVSLAGNNLTSITPVTSLSIHFPDIKNLSLEDNGIEDFKAMEAWKTRFRSLEQLIMIGNPITTRPDYKDEMIRRYPKLNMLDNVPVDRANITIGDADKSETSKPFQQPSTAVDANGRPILSLPTKGNLLVDHNSMAMNFLAEFFTQVDTDKEGVLAKFYTPESKFSVSVNTSAPRVNAQQGERQFWDPYIPKSRNMKRVHEVSNVVDRLAQGPAEIREMWKALPQTQHNLAVQEIWSFDVIPVDITPGVPGLLAVVHSEFDEMNPSMNASKGGVIKRSFDRSFTLWADAAGAIKVVSDVLIVRSYAGSTAWKADPEAPDAPSAGAEVAQPATYTPAELAEMQDKCRQLAEKSGLTLQYAEMCLQNSNWDLAAAWNTFIFAKDNGNLGPEAFAAPQ